MRYILDLPFSDYSLKVGYTNESELELQRDNFLDIMSSQTNLLLMMKEYYSSYKAVSPISLYSFKDLLISEMIGLSLISSLYKQDGSLTPHTRRLSEAYPKALIYPELNSNKSKRYGGLYGTFAYWIPSTEGSILRLYESALDSYWKYFILNPQLSPLDKVKQYVDYVFQNAPLETWLSLVNSSDLLYKRNLLSNEDFNDLGKKLVWNSYNPLAISYLSYKLEGNSEFSLLLDRALRTALPGGIKQFLLAIAIESFVNSVNAVLSYPNQSLDQLPVELSRVLAENYAVAYDCLLVLDIPNRYDKDVYYFLSRSNINSINSDSPLFVSSAL